LTLLGVTDALSTSEKLYLITEEIGSHLPFCQLTSEAPQHRLLDLSSLYKCPYLLNYFLVYFLVR